MKNINYNIYITYKLKRKRMKDKSKMNEIIICKNIILYYERVLDVCPIRRHTSFGQSQLS